MTNYVLIYHGGPQFSSREEGMAYMQKWKDWMDGLGDAVVDRGVPFGQSGTVGPEGVIEESGADSLSGYTVLRADNLDAAMELVKPCPHAAFGTIGVYEAMDMPM